MKYLAPDTLDEMLVLLNELGSAAVVLAGGQDVVPLMNQGLLFPENLLDLRALRYRAGIRQENGSLVIHALTPHREIERSELVRSQCGLLAEAARQIGGGLQVRNRGTIGGSVCAGSPIYDFAPCLVALGAKFRLRNVSGERWVTASQFFLDANVTAKQPNELLEEIVVPTHGSQTGFAYEKLKFSDGCYGIAGAACSLQLNADGSIRDLHLALGGVEPVPTRLTSVERKLTGAQPTERILSEVGELARSCVRNPMSDVQANGEYRLAMVGVIVRRALEKSLQRIRQKE